MSLWHHQTNIFDPAIIAETVRLEGIFLWSPTPLQVHSIYIVQSKSAYCETKRLPKHVSSLRPKVVVRTILRLEIVDISHLILCIFTLQSGLGLKI